MCFEKEASRKVNENTDSTIKNSTWKKKDIRRRDYDRLFSCRRIKGLKMHH
jgi:hypothetical protein